MVERDKPYFMAPVTGGLVVEQPNNALHPTPVAAVSCAFVVCCAGYRRR